MSTDGYFPGGGLLVEHINDLVRKSPVMLESVSVHVPTRWH